MPKFTMNMLLSSLKSSKIPLQGIFLAVIASLLLSPKALANSSLPSLQQRSPATQIQLQPPKKQPTTTLNAQGTAAGRSLEIQEIRGSVTLKGRKPAANGDRLSATGDEIVTGDNSQVRLAIDNDLGIIEVSENTTLQIETLSTAADGTPITAIAVSKGRVRLSIRHSAGKPDRPNALKKPGETRIAGLNNLKGIGQITELAQSSNSAKNAPVRVRTPRGVAGVRGTSFGVSVGPDGKTAVHTIDGAVAVAGTQQEVIVNAGYWVVINGAEPTSAQLSPSLSELKVLSFVRLSSNIFRLVGQVAPMDLVYVNNELIQTNAEGRFKLEGNLPLSRRLKVTVRGPSVRERIYELAAL